MTISAVQSGTEITITNDDPAAVVVVNESFLQNGSRGIGAQVKRLLKLGPGGDSSITKQLVNTVRSWVTPIIVPDVVGLTQAAAESALVSVDLVKGTVTNSTDPVVSQSPVAGSSVLYNSAVNLTMTV